MSRAARSAVIVILAILILVLYVQFSYRKNSAQITELKKEHALVSDSLSTARAVAARLPEMERKLEILRQQWEKAQEMLPSSKEIPELLRSLTIAGEKAGVKFLLFQPLATKQEQYYTEVPIQLNVRATYHSLGRFLSAMGNLPRIVNVSKLNLRPISGERETVEANMTATTYVLVKKATPAQPRRPRGR